MPACSPRVEEPKPRRPEPLEGPAHEGRSQAPMHLKPEREPAPEPAPVARRTSAPPATLLPNIVWRPAPDWLDEARLNQQRRCQPSELAIKLGTRTKMIG
ncbi:MAG: hypothetical protein EBX60_00605 [Betaproteobacteria bacterium]|nr:hypothetical protein [Betaproteobacteria bacterium]